MLKQTGITVDDRRAIYRWVQDLCRLNLRMPSGETLLHLCVSQCTNSNRGFGNAKTKTYPNLKSVEADLILWIEEDTIPFLLFRFPNKAGLRLLLTFGSRWLGINAMDSQGSTPLHIACQGEASHTMIKLLIHHGSHLDSVDTWGRTPVSYTKDENIIQLLTPRSKVDELKCLCARFTAKEDLKSSLMDMLSADLKKFVRLHDARRS
jgi:Ankyrin repeat